jgi:hypothetical protein
MAAIYHFWDPGVEVLLTTTLYPVDVDDSIALEITFTGGTMIPIPQTAASGTFGVGDDGTLQQLRWFYTDGPYFNDASGTFGPGDDGVLRSLLIIGDTPDEEQQITVRINDTCTMDLI